MKLLVKNALIHTMEDNQVPFRGDMLCDEGKIVRIDTHIDEDDSMERLEADGLWLFPGFIDAHSHIGIWEENIGISSKEVYEEKSMFTPGARGIDGLNFRDSAFRDARSAGVTTVITGPGNGSVVTGPGCGSLVPGTFLAMKTGGRHIDEELLEQTVALGITLGETVQKNANKQYGPMGRRALFDYLTEKLYEIKQHTDYDSYRESLDESSYTEEDIHVMNQVFSGELPVMIHCARKDDIEAAIDIMEMFGIRGSLVQCSEGDLHAEKLAELGVPVIVGPLCIHSVNEEANLLTNEVPARLVEKGVCIALGTDHTTLPVQFISLNAALAVRGGLPWKDAIKAVTIWAAEIAGIDDRVGSLKVGKDGDFVLFDGDPLHYRTKTVAVYIDGEVRYRSEVVEKVDL